MGLFDNNWWKKAGGTMAKPWVKFGKKIAGK